jgi:hypothetical protein
MSRPRRASLALTGAMLLTLLAASAAQAVPVRFSSHVAGRPYTTFSVVIYKSPLTTSCTASGTASLWRYPGPVRVRSLTDAVNVCLNRVGTTATRFGRANGRWATGTLAAGRYRTCVAASQRLTSGAIDRDVACRGFSLS